MDTLVSPVTLIVKSCNQQFEDQVISCEMNWTIKKLKQQLEEVYPTKPKTEEQKLIYSGQLLHDGIVLKDILRQYEGQSTHTVHLVFTPKQMKEDLDRQRAAPAAKVPPEERRPASTDAGTSADSTDGLRQRNVAATSAPTAPMMVPNIASALPHNAFMNPNLFYNPFQSGFVPQNATPATSQSGNGDYMSSQQIAMQTWMQQAYVQYVNQYMNMLQLGAQSTPLYASAATGNSPNFAYFHTPNAHQVQQQPPQASSVVAGAAAAPAPVVGQGPADAAAAAAPGDAAAAQPPQRRFPNIVVEEPQENRDWLDMSYFMLRIIVVLSVIYLYSSPLRCLAVFSIGIALYLYRRGVFQNQLERNLNGVNNPNNNNNNANVNNNNNNAVAQPGAAEGGGAAAAAANVGAVAAEDTVAPQDQSRTSWLVMIRTFILSFIFSLIPETPAL